MKSPKTDLAIYIHWPFCKSKCPYCDFNSHVSEAIDHNQWKQAYIKEISHYARKFDNRNVTSIFFGGGTPSLMRPEVVEEIINAITKYWKISSQIEITLEANPTSVEVEKLRAIKAAGVNRISMGVQSFNDKNLKFLGRGHSSEEAKSALREVRRIYDNYSFDIIYALPGQSLDELNSEIKTALSLSANHLSLYQLTIEKGTPFFADHASGKFILPDEDMSTQMYELVESSLSKVGLENYEVSNYAKPGFESRHNLTYWRYGEFLGIGPGAHGRLRRSTNIEATVNIHKPEKWLSSVLEKGSGVQKRDEIDSQSVLEEFLIMGLRLKSGISNDNFINEIGSRPEEVLDFSSLRKHGLIEADELGFRATKSGRLVLNSVIAKLLQDK